MEYVKEEVLRKLILLLISRYLWFCQTEVIKLRVVPKNLTLTWNRVNILEVAKTRIKW